MTSSNDPLSGVTVEAGSNVIHLKPPEARITDVTFHCLTALDDEIFGALTGIAYHLSTLEAIAESDVRRLLDYREIDDIGRPRRITALTGYLGGKIKHLHNAVFDAMHKF